MIKELFSKVDEHIEKGDLIPEFNMSALPSLYDHFVQLIEYLVCMKNLGLILISSDNGSSLPEGLRKILDHYRKRIKRKTKMK